MLAGCFHDDGTIRISWISGPAKDFIARSRALAAARKPGEHSKHLISGPWIRVNRDRAFSRCHVNLHIRTTIDGHKFDLQSWLRFSICWKEGTMSGASSSALPFMKKTAWSQSIRVVFPKTSSTIWICRHFQHQPSLSLLAAAQWSFSNHKTSTRCLPWEVFPPP